MDFTFSVKILWANSVYRSIILILVCLFRRYGEQKWILRPRRREKRRRKTRLLALAASIGILSLRIHRFRGWDAWTAKVVNCHAPSSVCLCVTLIWATIRAIRNGFLCGGIKCTSEKWYAQKKRPAHHISAFSICWFAYWFSVYRMLIVAILVGSRVFFFLYCPSFVDIERNKFDFRGRSAPW